MPSEVKKGDSALASQLVLEFSDRTAHRGVVSFLEQANAKTEFSQRFGDKPRIVRSVRELGIGPGIGCVPDDEREAALLRCGRASGMEYCEQS
jgi:hypothetical protein